MTQIDYKAVIKRDLLAKIPKNEITRKIYLSYPTFALSAHPEQEFILKNEVSKKYGVSIYCIHFGGSGKTGESYHKVNNFVEGESDLDAAIIDSSLYLRYLEEACTVTDGFRDLTKFNDRIEDLEIFTKYLKRGIIIPEKMPSCYLRSDWIRFFNNISSKHVNLFDNINCWIYSSQKIFELKFNKTIELLEKSK